MFQQVCADNAAPVQSHCRLVRKYFSLFGIILILSACGQTESAQLTHHDDHTDLQHDQTPSNRIAIPANVRRNLGLTFAAATYRPVVDAVSVPGYFEVSPTNQHHYPLPAAGRVTVHVQQLQVVHKGQLLLELDAPAWRSLQQDLYEAEVARLYAETANVRAQAAYKAAGKLLAEDEKNTDRPNVFSSQKQSAQADVRVAETRLRQLLASASTLTGVPIQQLDAEVDGIPHWQQMQRIPIFAVADGVVRDIDSASGTWVEEGTEVIHVIDNRALRFRATALQADVFDGIRDGQRATIRVPAGKGSQRQAAVVDGTVRIGVTGNPTMRTTDIFIELAQGTIPEWVRPKVRALADIAVRGDPELEELTIPQRALIQDGLETVFFRRDPNNPDQVIRTIADIGPSDGAWVVVYSGLGEGDEVVIDGVYQLKLATTGQKVEAGHFHADGTWHEGAH